MRAMLPDAILGSRGPQALPDDILLDLFTRLNNRDRLKLGQTCKRLQAVTVNPSLPWAVELEAPLELPTTQDKAQALITWLHRRATAVEQLTFDLTSQPAAPGAVEAYARRVWPYVYRAMLLCRHNLQRFKLTWEGPFVLGPWVANGFPKLTTIDLRVGRVQLGEGLQQVSALRSLGISESAANIASLPTSLTNLRLDGCHLTRLPAGLSALEQLERLDIFANSLADSSFAALSSLQRLRLLNLGFCELSSMPVEVSCLTGLEMLSLDGNHDIPMEELAVLSSLSRLEVLVVSDCDLRGPLPAALSALGSLRSLYCHDNAIAAFAGASPLLSRVLVPALGLADLCRCLDELRLAQNLVTLYITRSDDPLEQQCTGLLEVLSSLPCLKSVFYIEPYHTVVLRESYEFGRLLQRLWSKAGCQVEFIEECNLPWRSRVGYV